MPDPITYVGESNEHIPGGRTMIGKELRTLKTIIFLWKIGIRKMVKNSEKFDFFFHFYKLLISIVLIMPKITENLCRLIRHLCLLYLPGVFSS